MAVESRTNWAFRIAFYAFILVAITGDFMNMVNIRETNIHILYTNIPAILIIALLLILYEFSILKLKTAFLLAFIITVANLIAGMYLYLMESSVADFGLFFIRETLIIFVMVSLSVFVSKYIAFGLNVGYILNYFIIVFISGNEFLKENFLMINLAMLAYTLILIFITTLLKNYSVELRDNNKMIYRQKIDLLNRQLEIKKINFSLHQKNRTLEEAQEHLYKSNQTKDKIFEIIAHDLRNPINVISGFSKILLKREYIESHDLEIIARINESIKNTNDILENLMYWARSHGGEMEYTLARIGLNDLLHEVSGTCSGMAANKEIDIKVEVIGDLWIHLDPNLIAIVIRNLITNAIKFTKRGGEIEVGAEKIIGPDDYIVIEIYVSDNGIGIEKERLDNLLKKFYYDSTYGTNSEKGTGLGLKICRDMIAMHGSQLMIESEAGIGSKFYFRLTEIEDERA